MFGKRRPATAGLTAILIAGLAACGSGNGGGDGPPPVSGLKDTIRHVSRQTAKATRPHMVKRCKDDTRQVKHSSGSGKKKRSWYTTEHYQDCTKVRSGTENYLRTVRPERWCVSLDDVGGNKKKDDVWYRVTRSTYDDAVQLDYHARMKFVPDGNGTGC